MDSLDLQTLQTACDWAARGRRFALVTVARTWGSAPRPPGAWLALRDDGAVVGSVSGGCVEDDLIDRMKRGRLKGDRPFVLTYGAGDAETARVRLPCGGVLELVIEPAPDTALLDELRRRLADGRRCARQVDLIAGTASLLPAGDGYAVSWDGGRLTTPHGPRWRLLLIGVGPLSHCVAEIATALDYQVSVCDPRRDYARQWTLPGVELLTLPPDDAVVAFRPDSHSAVMTLSHDPKLDDLALLAALPSPAFYVGALGSRASVVKRRERLRQLDLPADALARLRGPIGVYIGSRTPAEIAVSILAELTAVKNGVAQPGQRPPSDPISQHAAIASCASA